jgi:hypothetical protein
VRGDDTGLRAFSASWIQCNEFRRILCFAIGKLEVDVIAYRPNPIPKH